jgi:diaminopimelate decarboxylase
MAGFAEKDGVLHADSVPLPLLAAEYGTPCYIYSASALTAAAARLKGAFAEKGLDPLIAYACKANGNIALLRLFAAQGLGADVVSGGELARALAAGMPGERIVFSGVGKSDDEITTALAENVRQINVESRPELMRIAAIASAMGRRAPVAFRFNPDVDAGTHAKITTGKSENKFGLSAEEIAELYGFAQEHAALDPQGLSIHIGSQLTSLAPFAEAFDRLVALYRALAGRGYSVPTLDLGGGIGVTYANEQPPALADYAALAAKVAAAAPGVKLVVEPGRLLVAEAGLLLSRIAYVKESRGRSYAILDAGMNDLIRPSLYDAWHPIRLVARHEGKERPYDIVGPVCETGDTFATGRTLPELREGELVAIMAAGAYGFAMASQYNTRPLPAEILVQGGKHGIIRQRESIRDIIDKDIVPEWLEKQPLG